LKKVWVCQRPLNISALGERKLHLKPAAKSGKERKGRVRPGGNSSQDRAKKPRR